MAGTWARSADSLTVAWMDTGEPPDLDLLREEVARLASVLGADLDLNVTPR